MRLLKIVLIFLLGFLCGNLFWYLASPLWIDNIVNEQALNIKADVEKKGNFINADQSHRGSGKVILSKTSQGKILRFENFNVTNGPDLYVWLLKAKNIKNAQDVNNSQRLEVAPLKGNIGDQNYNLPNDIKLDDYHTAIIWCKQFGVLFASASLK